MTDVTALASPPAPDTRNPALRFVLVTVFIDMLGIGLMLPVLPGLVGELVDSPDQQAYAYGLLMMVFGLVQFLAMPLLGALSDRYGRRPVLLLSIAGLGFSYLVSATTTSLVVLILARLVSGATSACMTVANAYAADILPPSQRSKGFGAIGAAFGLGFIIGPVLGGVLATSGDIRLPFWVAAGMSLVNAVYGWWLLPESLPREQRRPIQWKQANPVGALTHLRSLHGVGPLLVIYALVLLAQWIMHTTWVLYTTFRFQWTPADNGYALCLVGLMAVLAQGVLLGGLVKRWGEVSLARRAILSACLASIAYGSVPEGWMLYVLIVLNMLAFTATPALQAVVSHAAPAHEQGLTQGALNSIASLCTVVAPLIGTPLLGLAASLPADDWRLGGTFYVSAVLQAVALMLILRYRPAPRHDDVPPVQASV